MDNDIYTRVDIRSCFIDEKHSEVTRNLVDATYPPNFFNRTALLRLLHINRTRNAISGTTISGYKDFKRVMGYVNVNAFRNANDYLAANDFIEFKSKNKTVTCYLVNIAPLYDRDRKAVIHPLGHRLIMNARNQYKPWNDFIKLPNVLFDVGMFNSKGISRLTTDEINILLKIYRFNFLEIFGGADFGAIRYENGNIIVASSIYEDIYLSHDEFIAGLISLQAKGLVSWVDVIVDIVVIDGIWTVMNFVSDLSMFTGVWKSTYKTIKVLRPYYQTLMS